ncbi:right-handed parallel beta-helix repeat-containing protein [Mycobacterium manitobense]|uniref:Right-handed parallel beta-helix repeat-containing protein n=2 Tax=[Mycobacterium] manitobense TaxID=190147 RepID=A0A9X2YC77_9MYCO|nr:right-handed parallel beta-helix repeat-containing protein [[Mycobacterium] manitobense]
MYRLSRSKNDVLRSSAAAVVAVLAVAAGLAGDCVAVGDPLEDSSALLQREFDQLKPGEALTLDRETFNHDSVLHIDVPGVRIDGNGARLQATNDETSSVQITAPGVTLTNVTLSAPPSGRRWTGLDQHKLVVRANDVTVRGVVVDGSAAAGVFVQGAENFRIDGVTVEDTRADGIHVTGGSGNGQINNPATARTGDDGVAVVSYADDAASCADIVVNSPVVNGTRWGRGVSVVGGENVSIRNLHVDGTSGAGVYIASEGGPQYYTRSAHAIDVSGGTVTNANVNPGVIQGAVLVYAGNASEDVSNVSVSDLTISNTAKTAQRNIGIVVDAGTVGDIALRGIRLEQTSLPALDANTPPSGYSATDFTLDGNAIVP